MQNLHTFRDLHVELSPSLAVLLLAENSMLLNHASGYREVRLNPKILA